MLRNQTTLPKICAQHGIWVDGAENELTNIMIENIHILLKDWMISHVLRFIGVISFYCPVLFQLCMLLIMYVVTM